MVMIYLCTIMLSAGFFLRLSVEKLMIVSGKWWKRLLILFSCWLLLATIIYIGDPANILLMILFFLASIQVACEGGIWKKQTIGLMFAGTVFAFNALRDNYLLTHEGRCLNPERTMLLESLCTLTFVFLLYMGIGKFAPDREYKLSDRMWKLLLLLTMNPVGIVLSVVVLHKRYWPEPFNSRTIPLYFALLVIALFSIIGLLWSIMVLAKQQELEEKGMLAEINRSYYESMEEQHFAIRRLKHDLANHLSVMLVLPEHEREGYIKSLIDDSMVTDSLQYCGDATVNAILSVKGEQMKRYGIRLETEIGIPGELPFEKADVCALFANVLDNAAEACRKLGEDKRKVLLKSKLQKGLFCLEVKNAVGCTAENPAADVTLGTWNEKDVLPPTSKQDKENHGIGLRSMKKIVKKYNGAMELCAKGDTFAVFLYMPV